MSTTHLPCSLALVIALTAAAALLACASSARADFGLLPGDAGFLVRASEEDGSAATLAGAHPYALSTEVNLALGPESPGQPGVPFSDGDLKGLQIHLPPGLIENPAAVHQCSQVQFHTPRQSPFEPSFSGESCPDVSQVGTVTVRTSLGGGSSRTFGVFNLTPPSGFPSQLGFSPYGSPITITPHVRGVDGEYGLDLQLTNFPQQLDVLGFKMTIWGTPWEASHDQERGNCLNEAEPSFPQAKCKVPLEPQAYLTLPTSCNGPLVFHLTASSWQQPGVVERTSRDVEPLTGCAGMPFDALPVARLSTGRTTSSTGFEFTLTGAAEGLVGPEQRAISQPKQVIVDFPAGMTINPSVGAGLGVCTPAQYAAETAFSDPGAGCPNVSKIGEVSVESPLFAGVMGGSLFLAEPDDPTTSTPGAENPFDSLIALYLVAKSPERGVIVRLAGKVTANHDSGQLTATFEDLPQLPYSHFNVRFRDGQRSPLATPSACGTYVTGVDFAPWNNPAARRHEISLFHLTSGVGGGPCPSGVPPFHPQATAGILNRNAGSYSPFYLHLTRNDDEQEITSYSAQMPPGLLGRLRGVPYCPEAAIAEARQRSGFAEAAEPSCPAASSIGHTTSGYGLGSVLAYAPGGLYLAGPYHGAPFSIVAIDSATVGPFDLGVIVVRAAIRIDPHTAQVLVDSEGSDPIPHIIKGIPLHLRDVRVYIDRPNFTLNPTSCERFSTVSSLTGSGLDFGSGADDSRASAPSPFQVSNCSALGFKPRLSLQLRGATKRGAYPTLKATMRPRPGDANLGRVVVTLPPSEFLAQEHLETVCTRAQFDVQRCPSGSVYGHARAVTPLLGQPLEGPVYLRSNGKERLLPDLVIALSGAGVNIDVVGKIDSSRGGLRGTFDVIPDAPVSKFVMTLNGGKRHGILQNAENVCRAAPALARMVGQNNRGLVSYPHLTNPRCAKKAKARRSHHRRRGNRR